MAQEFIHLSLSRGLSLVLDKAWFAAASVAFAHFFPIKTKRWDVVMIYALFLTILVYVLQIILKKLLLSHKSKNSTDKPARLTILLDKLMGSDPSSPTSASFF